MRYFWLGFMLYVGVILVDEGTSLDGWRWHGGVDCMEKYYGKRLSGRRWKRAAQFFREDFWRYLNPERCWQPYRICECQKRRSP